MVHCTYAYVRQKRNVSGDCVLPNSTSTLSLSLGLVEIPACLPIRARTRPDFHQRRLIEGRLAGRQASWLQDRDTMGGAGGGLIEWLARQLKRKQASIDEESSFARSTQREDQPTDRTNEGRKEGTTLP